MNPATHIRARVNQRDPELHLDTPDKIHSEPSDHYACASERKRTRLNPATLMHARVNPSEHELTRRPQANPNEPDDPYARPSKPTRTRLNPETPTRV